MAENDPTLLSPLGLVSGTANATRTAAIISNEEGKEKRNLSEKN